MAISRGGRRDELVPGVFITPTLRLRRKLGGGGMGSVWVAHHGGLQTDVVVKFIATAGEAPPSENEIARFQREAALIAQVRSPHVVQVLDCGKTSLGTPYIAMELLEGEDLESWLMDHGPMAPHEVVPIVQQVAKALDRAHELGIIHRDVKPGNVFLCKDGLVKLLDFGLAKRGLVNSLTVTGDAIGTLPYMSPEQALDSKATDFKTDIWSLGVTVFQMLTGKMPFGHGNAAMVAMAIVRGPIPKPTAIRPELPPALDDWFARACERDSRKRFASAGELAAALEEALADEAPTLRDPTH